MTKPMRVNIDPFALSFDAQEPETCRAALGAGLPLARALEAEHHARSARRPTRAFRPAQTADEDHHAALRAEAAAAFDAWENAARADRTDRHQHRRERKDRADLEVMDRKPHAQAAVLKDDSLYADCVQPAEGDWDDWFEHDNRRARRSRLLRWTAGCVFVATTVLVVAGGSIMLLLTPGATTPATSISRTPASGGETVLTAGATTLQARAPEAGTPQVVSPQTARPDATAPVATLPRPVPPDAVPLPSVRSREVPIGRSGEIVALTAPAEPVEARGGTTWLAPSPTVTASLAPPPAGTAAVAPNTEAVATAAGSDPAPLVQNVERATPPGAVPTTTAALAGAGQSSSLLPLWDSTPARPRVRESAAAGGIDQTGSSLTTAQVTTDVNMRAGPDNAEPVITIVRVPNTVEVIECKIWCEVEFQGQRGWIFRDYIDQTGTL